MCDTFVLLPEYTNNHHFYFAKNSDRDPNEAHEVVLIPEIKHGKEESVKCTYISIAQVEKTHKVLLCKPVWIWGAEMGVNEFGVVIGNEAVFSKIPAGKEPGLIGMDYLRLGLERGKTARDALNIITTLLEQYGQSGNCGFMHPFYYHNSFMIADKNEAWKLETVEKHWIAKKVNGFDAISNGYTIETEWDLISPNLISMLKGKGWVSNGENFNFRESVSDWLITTFSDSKQRKSCSIRNLSLTGPATTLPDIFSILRSHRDEESFNPDKGVTGADLCMHSGFGPIRVSQTTGSMVVEQNDDNLVIWVTGSSAPCLSVFKPMSISQELNYIGPSPELQYDANSYWWQQERIHRKILENYPELSQNYKQEIKELEANFIDRMKKFDGQTEILADCFDDAIRFQSKWVDKLKNQKIKDTRKIPYKIVWNKNNQLAGIPKE